MLHKEDNNISYCWNMETYPAGSSLWIPLAGRLNSYGSSCYHSFPDYFCPHIIVSGHGTIEVNGKKHDVTRGDMFTLWPSQEICYHDYSDTPWEFYYFHLQGADQTAYATSLGLNKSCPVNRPENPERIIKLFDTIWQLMKKKPAGGQYKILSSLFAIPGLCKTDTIPPASDHLLEDALALIESSRNPAGINVNELCERLNVSRVTLYRKFTSKLNRTPIDYIIDHRLQAASRLLRETSKTIAEIAALSGFNSEKYLMKIFKRHFKQTPTEFRNKK